MPTSCFVNSLPGIGRSGSISKIVPNRFHSQRQSQRQLLRWGGIHDQCRRAGDARVKMIESLWAISCAKRKKNDLSLSNRKNASKICWKISHDRFTPNILTTKRRIGQRSADAELAELWIDAACRVRSRREGQTGGALVTPPELLGNTYAGTSPRSTPVSAYRRRDRRRAASARAYRRRSAIIGRRMNSAPEPTPTPDLSTMSGLREPQKRSSRRQRVAYRRPAVNQTKSMTATRQICPV